MGPGAGPSHLRRALPDSRRPRAARYRSRGVHILVEQDAREPGRRHPDFAAAPFDALSCALTVAADDAQTRQEYRDHLLPLIYGSYRPDFDEAFESFREVGLALLATLER